MAFKWQHPEWLWIGPALLVATLLASWIFHRWRMKVWRELDLSEDGNLTTGKKGVLRFFTRHTLLALALAFIGLSLANLQMGGQTQKVQRQGADVVFALDVSRSMWAEDIAPNRLQKAKLLMSKSIDALGGDRVGIVAYAGSAYPALPITTDYAAAKMALQSASPDQVPSQGTNLAAALEYAQEYFNPASPAGRFIIVLTDGEDHEYNDLTLDSEMPVNVMLVGVGTPTGGPIPMGKDRAGTSYKKDQNGEVVITRRDEQVLGEIAQKLQAFFVDGNNTESALAEIQEFIENGEKSDIQEEIAMNYDSQFMWFLIPGLALLLLYLMLPNRVPLKTIGLLAFLLSTSAAQGQNLHEYGKAIREGNKALTEGNIEGALERYDAAAAAQPDAFLPKYNQGTARLQSGDMEGASGALLDAVQSTENPSEQSDALYNLGNLLMANEKYKEAAGAYIESLKRQPGRKDAIYNLNRALEKQKQQEQQQEQEQDQDQEQEKEEEKEQSDNQQEDPQEENQDDQNSKKDQDQEGQGDEGENEPNEEQQKDQDGEPGDQNQPKDGGESKAKMTPEEIKGLLEAIQRAEEKTAEKMNAKKAKGKKKSGEKDW